MLNNLHLTQKDQPIVYLCEYNYLQKIHSSILVEFVHHNKFIVFSKIAVTLYTLHKVRANQQMIVRTELLNFVIATQVSPLLISYTIHSTLDGFI